MCRWSVILAVLALPVLHRFPAGDGFRILGICPSTSYSHQQPFQALMKALAGRGHAVTVLTTILLQEPVENYEQVDLSFTYERKDCTGLRHVNAFALLHKNMREGNALCERQLFSPAVQGLISRNKSFDAVIVEQLWYQCYYGLVKHYGHPVLIGFLTVGNLPYAMDSVGNPDDPLLNPDMAYPFTNRMTMKERLWNVLYTSWTRIYYRYWHLPRAQRIAEKFAPGTSVRDTDRNFSLVILGNNHVFGYPKPLLPNVIEVHSLQMKEEDGETLPKDIQEFLDGAVDGAIYFSLGSNLQTGQLPIGPLTALRNALGSLDQRVLWKHAGDASAPSGNIKFVNWAPQQAVLAHPKVLAYVMQGGLQSMQEAVHYSVPMIAIPFFGDQLFNSRKIVDAGIGLTLDIDTLTEESVLATVDRLIRNHSYHENIRRMSSIVRDELVKPMDRAVWNIEHVIKFRNSSHLRYHGHRISFLDYYSTIGILIFLGALAPAVSLVSLFIAFRRIKCKLLRSNRQEPMPVPKPKHE